MVSGAVNHHEKFEKQQRRVPSEKSQLKKDLTLYQHSKNSHFIDILQTNEYFFLLSQRGVPFGIKNTVPSVASRAPSRGDGG